MGYGAGHRGAAPPLDRMGAASPLALAEPRNALARKARRMAPSTQPMR